jgi:hypothetical protein
MTTARNYRLSLKGEGDRRVWRAISRSSVIVGPLFAFGLAPSPTTGPSNVARYYAEHTGVLQSIQVLRGLRPPSFWSFWLGCRSGSAAWRASLRCRRESSPPA